MTAMIRCTYIWRKIQEDLALDRNMLCRAVEVQGVVASRRQHHVLHVVRCILDGTSA